MADAPSADNATARISGLPTTSIGWAVPAATSTSISNRFAGVSYMLPRATTTRRPSADTRIHGRNPGSKVTSTGSACIRPVSGQTRVNWVRPSSLRRATSRDPSGSAAGCAAFSITRRSSPPRNGTLKTPMGTSRVRLK
jgi:hypothetical protein